MRNKFGKLLTTAVMAGSIALGLLSFSSQAEADGPKSLALWAGIGLKEDVFAGYGGGVFALNGDLGMDGFLIKVGVLYVDYEFDTGLAPGGEADGDLYRGNALIGYQIANEQFVAALFAGIDLQDRDISPGVADDGSLDDDVGFMLNGRIATNGARQFPMELEASYSTANNTFWSRARIGYSLDAFVIGPEGAILGNDAYTEVRIGGFAKFSVSDSFSIGVEAGYADQVDSNNNGSESGGDSVYGGAHIVVLY